MNRYIPRAYIRINMVYLYLWLKNKMPCLELKLLNTFSMTSFSLPSTLFWSKNMLSVNMLTDNYPYACIGDIVIASVRVSVCPSVCPCVCPSVCYAISSQTAGQNPTKFGEWLAYTSGACSCTFIFGPAPRGPGEVSKGQLLTSLGICDGVPSTVRSI